MKKLLLSFLLLAFNVNAQFIHLGTNEKSEDDVSIVFEDGSIKNGFVKNNRAKNKALRALAFSSNSNALNTPELAVDFILFKESKEAENYQEIDVMRVSQVIFKNPEKGFLAYDRTTMYDINAKTLEVDYSNPKKMFFQSNDLPGFKRYRIFVSSSQRGSILMYTPFYYLKHPNKNEVVYVNPWSMVIHNRIVNYFKYVGSNCPAFIAYLDKVADKKSEEYKALEQTKKDLKKEAKELLKLRKKEYKENKKAKIPNDDKVMTLEEFEQIRKIGSAKPYEFLYQYFYQKYLDCGCDPI